MDQAKRQGGKNLEALGLEGHEIARIEYDSNLHVKGDTLKTSLKQQRAEMEKELQNLRNKLQTLKLGVPVRQKPETPRAKPAILKEKPNIFEKPELLKNSKNY